MKIVCISSARVPSDTANSIQVMKVCQAFVQLGYELTLLVPGGKPEGLSEADLMRHYGLSLSFEIEWLPGRARRFFPWKAAWRAMRLGADLIYAWPLQAAVLGNLAGKTTLVELHDLPSGRFGATWLKIYLRLGGKRRLLPITSALREALKLPASISVVAPDGVDGERYADLPEPEQARSALGLPAGMTVVCTGHLYEGRGSDLFLALAGKFPSIRFTWVGGRSKEVEKVRARVEAMGLKNVTLTGFVANELIPMYQASGDILLMPYERRVATSSGGNTAEVCSPMKMFEYMAAGRAIVSSDLPVLREVLDERMAIFCEPGEVAAWEAALSRLIGDGGLRERLGQKARGAVQGFSWIERARLTLEGLV